MTQLTDGKWNPTQIIGFLLAGGFVLGMIYAIIEAIIHRNRGDG